MSDSVRRVVLILVVAVLLAAIGVAVWARPGGPAEQAADHAIVERLLARPVADVDGVLADAALLHDPVLRQLALDEWVHRHVAELDGRTGERVCLALDGATRDVCLRKVSSPHLHPGARK